jgi:hypothetical protein
VRALVVVGVAALAFGGARVARTVARDMRAAEQVDEPYAPSPGSAPYLSLGYREATADLMYVQLRGYFGDPKSKPEALAELCEAIVALDPRFGRIYETCGLAMTLTIRSQIDQSIFHRALAVIERGIREYPNDWRLLNLAAQVYSQDLKTEDPAQRREWDEKATLLIETAIRKPGAPANLADYAAVMRTRFGQHERAVQGLREMILTTTDLGARKALLDRLAEIEHEDADALAAELLQSRQAFEDEWKRTRPYISANWYVLLGPRATPGFDMVSLATGGRDLIAPTPEELPPVE